MWANASILFALLATIFVVMTTDAAPIGENGETAGVAASDQDILSASETGYWASPFWYRRPVNDEDDDGFYAGGDGGQALPWRNNNIRSSTYSYVAVGAGWGR